MNANDAFDRGEEEFHLHTCILCVACCFVDAGRAEIPCQGMVSSSLDGGYLLDSVTPVTAGSDVSFGIDSWLSSFSSYIKPLWWAPNTKNMLSLKRSCLRGECRVDTP